MQERKLFVSECVALIGMNRFRTADDTLQTIKKRWANVPRKQQPTPQQHDDEQKMTVEEALKLLVCAQDDNDEDGNIEMTSKEEDVERIFEERTTFRAKRYLDGICVVQHLSTIIRNEHNDLQHCFTVARKGKVWRRVFESDQAACQLLAWTLDVRQVMFLEYDRNGKLVHSELVFRDDIFVDEMIAKIVKILGDKKSVTFE
jgi:hypothetical protein